MYIVDTEKEVTLVSSEEEELGMSGFWQRWREAPAGSQDPMSVRVAKADHGQGSTDTTWEPSTRSVMQNGT